MHTCHTRPFSPFASKQGVIQRYASKMCIDMVHKPCFHPSFRILRLPVTVGFKGFNAVRDSPIKAWHQVCGTPARGHSDVRDVLF